MDSLPLVVCPPSPDPDTDTPPRPPSFVFPDDASPLDDVHDLTAQHAHRDQNPRASSRFLALPGKVQDLS